MKRKTKRQIQEAIAYWEGRLAAKLTENTAGSMDDPRVHDACGLSPDETFALLLGKLIVYNTVTHQCRPMTQEMAKKYYDCCDKLNIGV